MSVGWTRVRMARRFKAFTRNGHKSGLVAQLSGLVLAEVQPAPIVVRLETAVTVLGAHCDVEAAFESERLGCSIRPAIRLRRSNDKLFYIRIKLTSLRHIIA